MPKEPSEARKSSEDEEKEMTQISCDVLCALSAEAAPGETAVSNSSNYKSLHLPMFLSKTYHMIERCDPAIATWAEDGLSFIVKNSELFAQKYLPQYFKHSNFSSFARQLNFYGFRKLRTDPILTTEADPATANHVRFYHEYFQKGREDLMQKIKRATKSDQACNKSEVAQLKRQVEQLQKDFQQAITSHERRMAEVVLDTSSRISYLKAEYDKLTVAVQQLLAANPSVAASVAMASPPTTTSTDPLASLSHVAVSMGTLKRNGEEESSQRAKKKAKVDGSV